MNERIKELAEKAEEVVFYSPSTGKETKEVNLEKFAELIVEECRTVVTEVYRNTPLELCGPLLTADEKIAEHFYRVEE